MSKVVSEIGNRYGLLTVLERDGSIGSKAAWKCKCDCGIIKTITGDALRRGKAVSCGCQAKVRMREVGRRNAKDITNQTFGWLTAIDSIGSTTYGGRLWKCKCRCGNWHEVEYSNLVSNKVQSCGCMKSAGEAELQKLLTNYNIKYKTQYTPDGWLLSTNYKPYYDIALFKEELLICLIEYNGEQHKKYYSNANTWNNQENFEKTKRRDNEKVVLCKNHNVPLYIIWYDEDINESLLNILSKENFDF